MKLPTYKSVADFNPQDGLCPFEGIARVSQGVKPLETRVATFIGGYVSTPTERNVGISFKGDSPFFALPVETVYQNL